MKDKSEATYTFRLPKNLLKELKAWAEEHDESVSAVIRKAIKRYVAKP